MEPSSGQNPATLNDTSIAHGRRFRRTLSRPQVGRLKIEPRRIETLLWRLDPALRAVLLYGPDSGLVRERAETVSRSIVPDLTDPFRVIELSSRAIIADPPLLVDEVAALAFGGGRRVIRVRSAGDETAPSIAAALETAKGDALVVVEAGDLGPRSKLRSLFEASRTAAAIPCYVDDAERLADLIEQRFRQDGIGIAPEALGFLTDHLGGDRMVTRSEVEKLALYAGSGGRIELADAIACVGDSAGLSLDEIAFGVGEGDAGGMLRRLDRAYAEGNSPIAVLRAVARHFQRLHLAAGMVAAGERPEQALAALRPPVFFKQKDAFLLQLKRWPLNRLGTAIERLTEAEIGCKTTGLPDAALCARTLMELARAARREPRSG